LNNLSLLLALLKLYIVEGLTSMVHGAAHVRRDVAKCAEQRLFLSVGYGQHRADKDGFMTSPGYRGHESRERFAY